MVKHFYSRVIAVVGYIWLIPQRMCHLMNENHSLARYKVFPGQSRHAVSCALGFVYKVRIEGGEYSS